MFFRRLLTFFMQIKQTSSNDIVVLCWIYVFVPFLPNGEISTEAKVQFDYSSLFIQPNKMYYAFFIPRLVFAKQLGGVQKSFSDWRRCVVDLLQCTKATISKGILFLYSLFLFSLFFSL